MSALDDISGCPLGVRCEACGIESDDLAVKVCQMDRLGVACLTLCGRCGAATMAPPVAVTTASRMVMQHCGHLGITVDDMAELMEAEALGAHRGLTST